MAGLAGDDDLYVLEMGEGIRAVDGVAPAPNIEERIDALGVAAAAADRVRVMEMIGATVIGYVPSTVSGAFRTGELNLPVSTGRGTS